MKYRVFIIAGEASGDLLGEKIIIAIKNELTARLSNDNAEFTGIEFTGIEFTGIGGELMKNQGQKQIFGIDQLSIMGFIEILPHLFRIIRLINYTASEIVAQKPDLLITIDAPAFSFRVAKKVMELEQKNQSTTIKKIHLIAPSVWAYGAKRAEKIAKIYNLLLAILPFEPPYFTKYGLKTTFIGHPIVENITKNLKEEALGTEENHKIIAKKNFAKQFQISDSDLESFNLEKLIIITPGSRISEVQKIFPIFVETINLLAQKGFKIRLAIFVLPKTLAIVSDIAKNLNVAYHLIPQNQQQTALLTADFALAKSGTNNLEISLHKIPLLIAYKVNWLSFLYFNAIVKIRYANLINILANKIIIPEAIQKDCNPQFLLHHLENLMTNPNMAQKQISESQEMLKILGLKSLTKPTEKAGKSIVDLLLAKQHTKQQTL